MNKVLEVNVSYFFYGILKEENGIKLVKRPQKDEYLRQRWQ